MRRAPPQQPSSDRTGGTHTELPGSVSFRLLDPSQLAQCLHVKCRDGIGQRALPILRRVPPAEHQGTLSIAGAQFTLDRGDQLGLLKERVGCDAGR